MFGRFAPTPSSQLHIGNLRTALVAWLAARSSGRGFLVRVEDLDQPRLPLADTIMADHLADLAALGITHDGPIIRQKDRTPAYEQAMARLDGIVYECFCSRKDVADATRAPHGTTARYPGTCRNLTEAHKAHLRARRKPAWRVHACDATVTITDLLHGQVTAEVDDFVIRRADGVFAYNFAVTVDDGYQGVDQVVRGDDLLESAPRQAWLASVLGLPPVTWLHVPLVLAPDGTRLAKREGAASLRSLTQIGVTVPELLTRFACSLGLADPGESLDLTQMLHRFDVSLLPRDPWLTDPTGWV